MSENSDFLARTFGVQGVRALVTGASSGLGFAMAEALSDCGAHVTLASASEERLEEATSRLAERGGAVRSHVVDVADPAQVEHLVDSAVEEGGGLDVVFVNAGVGHAGFGVRGGETIDRIDGRDWDHVIGVNLNGAMYTVRAAAAVMKRQRAGRIVVTSSVAGRRPEPFVDYAYAASKAAVRHFVRQAALELAPSGILVNTISPGYFQGTRVGGGVLLDPDSEAVALWSQGVPVGRMARPEEIKGLALFLASAASSFITGAEFVIDGGISLLLGGKRAI